MSVFAEQSIAFVIGILASIVASAAYTTWVRRSESNFSFKQIVGFVLDLVNSLESDEYKPDLVVAIDRNSSIVGGIIAGHLGLRTIVTAATENRRMKDGSRSAKVVDGFLPNQNFLSHKRILLFICFNDSGTSLETVYHHLEANSPPSTEIRTAALFTSASPKMLPKYYVKKVGVNLKTPINQMMPKMPWVTKSWKHVFAKERYAN